jgi:hypothetical protein
MCQWLTRDRYIDLSRIVDAGVLGENVLEVAAKRVKSAFAGIELR